MTESSVATVPVTLVGWRVWDLFVGRDLEPDQLTRGVLVNLDRNGVVMPENDRQVSAGELEMILDLFGDRPLVFTVSTPADENRVPAFLDALVRKYPALKERTFQIVTPLRPPTCDELLGVKKKHQFKLILPHYTLWGAEVWSASVKLADQVLYDAGNGRDTEQLSLNDRQMSALQLVIEATEKTRVAIGLAGRVTGELIHGMELKIAETAATLKRPLAFCAHAPIRFSDGQLDLAKAKKYFDACAKVLHLPPPPAAEAAAP
jgi:hypothetical protein